MQLLLSLRGYHDGPNCWNAALYVSGTVPHILMTHATTARYYFDHVCQKLSTTIENAPVGSIVRYQKNGAEFHAFTKVGDNLFFEKGALAKDLPYALVDLGNVNQRYGGADVIEVLSCPEITEGQFKTNRGIEDLTSEFSQLLSGQKSFDAQGNNNLEIKILRLKSELPTLRDWVISTDLTSALKIFDLGISTAGSLPIAAKVKRELHQILWALSETFLERPDLSLEMVRSTAEFVEFSTGSTNEPAKLLRELRGLLGESSEALFRTAFLTMNPDVNFGDQKKLIDAALRSIEQGTSPSLSYIHRFMYLLKVSKSEIGDREQLFKRSVTAAIALAERGNFEASSQSDLVSLQKRNFLCTVAHTIIYSSLDLKLRKDLFSELMTKASTRTRDELRTSLPAYNNPEMNEFLTLVPSS